MLLLLRTNFRTITDYSRPFLVDWAVKPQHKQHKQRLFTDQGLFKVGLIAITDRCTMHQLQTNYGLFTDHRLLSDQLAVKFTIYCNYYRLFTTTDKEFLLVRNSMNGPFVVTGQRVIDLIEMGFNDTSTLVGHFVSSPREREKRDTCRRQ